MKIKQDKPLHPGDFIRRTFLDPFNICRNQVANKLCVNPSTFNRLINCKSNVVPSMALRLSIVFGRSPESWLMMQHNYDLKKVQKLIDLSQCEPIDFESFKN